MKTAKRIARLREQRQRNSGGWGQGVDPERWTYIKRFAGHEILDVGCSSGVYVKALRESGSRGYGADLLFDNMWLHTSASPFVVAEAEELPFPDNSFDTVTAFEILEHIENAELVIRELKRITRRNIIVSVPNCEHSQEFVRSKIAYHHWIDPTHVQFFSSATLASTLTQAGFSIQSMTYIDPIYPELFVFLSWGVPLRVAGFLQKLVNRVPWRKKYYLGILVAASVEC